MTSISARRFAFCFVCLATLGGDGTGAQERMARSVALAARVESIERTQERVLRELNTLTAQLGELRVALSDVASTSARPVPKTEVSLRDAATKGSHAAPVAVIEYADFQCPYCATFFRTTLPAIEDAYIRTGKVLFAFRHLPLVEIHPRALPAARAARCAGDQGRFWEYHDLLFNDAARLDDDSLIAHATSLGLDDGRFRRCIGGAESAVRIQQEASTSAALLVAAGTPTFLVGRLNADGSVTVSDRIDGTREFEAFRRVLDRLLETSRH